MSSHNHFNSDDPNFRNRYLAITFKKIWTIVGSYYHKLGPIYGNLKTTSFSCACVWLMESCWKYLIVNKCSKYQFHFLSSTNGKFASRLRSRVLSISTCAFDFPSLSLRRITSVYHSEQRILRTWFQRGFDFSQEIIIGPYLSILVFTSSLQTIFIEQSASEPVPSFSLSARSCRGDVSRYKDN